MRRRVKRDERMRRRLKRRRREYSRNWFCVFSGMWSYSIMEPPEAPAPEVQDWSRHTWQLVPLLVATALAAEPGHGWTPVGNCRKWG